MRQCLAAHTTLAPVYPGYVNISRNEDGTISVTVRGDPEERHAAYICGYAADKGAPGRCTPGDDRCNNYCNLSPEKGPMQDSPLPCAQIFEGKTSVVRLTADAWDALRAEIAKEK